MNLLQAHGAQPQKQPHYTPVFMDRTFTGIYKQRSVLHDPSDVATARFYGGRPDALWMGKNVELTNRLTLQRRPGLVPFSTATYSSTPLRTFPFQLTDGTIRVIVDTGTTGSLTLSQATLSGSSTIYTGTFPNGGSNAYTGMIFTIAGFPTNPGNNGSFVCTASTTTTITLSNSNGVNETHAATAISAGAVYWDQQNGSKTLLFGKSPNAGQTYFQAVAGTLYMGDSVDTLKWTPLNANLNSGNVTNPNVSVWNWGGVAPTVTPSVTTTSAGAAAGVWQANTYFLTMGLILDANGNVQQLTGVGGTPSAIVGTVALVGKSSPGGPPWNQTPGNTTADGGTVVWRNVSQIVQWKPGTAFLSETQAFSTNTAPCACYSSKSGCIYVAVQSASAGISSVDPGTRTSTPGVIIRGLGPFALDTVDWMCLGSVSTMPNGFCLGNWLPSHAVLAPPNQTRVIEPFTIPTSGQVLTAKIFLQESTNSGTTNSSFASISWATTVGLPTTEPAGSDGSVLTWTMVALGHTWVTGTQYTAWAPAAAGFGVVVDNNGSFWVAATTGTSGSYGGNDAFANAGVYWQSNHAYTQGTIIIDTNSNRQQAQNTGTSTNGVHPVWATTQGSNTTDTGVTWKNLGSAYGFQIGDNGITWVNVGQSLNWAASSKYYLPNIGFFLPNNQTSFGSPDVNDGTNIEFVVQSGISGGTVPSWNASSAPGSNQTVDSGAVWYNNGPFKQNSTTFSSGHNWAYSWKARSLTDFYSVASGVPPVLPIPPGNSGPLAAPTGSESNCITTASPVATISQASSGSVVVLVYGNYSPDPQFDTIVIWRDADGGGPSKMFELTEIPNIPSKAGSKVFSVNGNFYDWVFQDFLPDTPTAQFPGLNAQIPAPINHQNDPPLATYLPMAYNFQRIWGASGQNVLFSEGPDIGAGNPNEAFLPSDQLPFLASVVRLVRTPQGLVTMTVDAVELIAGGPNTASFYSVTLCPGLGLLSFNALDVYAGEIFFFSADNEFMLMSPSLNISNFGFPLGDEFANLATLSGNTQDATWNPANVYVAVHQSGIDNAIFVADGSTGWFRLNPRQVPGGLSGAEPIWSPFAGITNGAEMVESLEYTPGIKALTISSPISGGFQLFKRSLSVFTDNGTQYDAFFVMGGIMLAHPGQRALLKFIEADFSGVSYRPTVSFLLNEISGSFTPFTLNPQFDPPTLYGTTISPASYSPNRYYFAGVNAVAVCRHLQIKVDFGTTSNGDELYNLTIYGKLVVES